MSTIFKICATCLNSFYKMEYNIVNESFCSKKCIPRCGFCYKSFEQSPIVAYCNINKHYYCSNCESKKCKYCDLFFISNKCPNNCF